MSYFNLKTIDIFKPLLTLRLFGKIEELVSNYLDTLDVTKTLRLITFIFLGNPVPGIKTAQNYANKQQH